MSASLKSLTTAGIDGLVVDIECTLSNNLPLIVIVGFVNKAVGEAKERIRGAFANSDLQLPRKRITINLAPADLPKADSGFDLAIAISILAAGGQLAPAALANAAFIGELGLEGNTRAVRGIIGRLLAGRRNGLSDFFIPLANVAQAQLVPGVRLFPAANLRDVYNHLNGLRPLQPIITGEGITPSQPLGVTSGGLSHITGQDRAKRALEIAAAGGHNVLLSGPPGTGKSMLARALPALLPPLSHEEMLEVTHLHSLAGQEYERAVYERPLRAPHHSASHAAMTGSSSLRPGEISLAHRGVLLLDELPEFNRNTVEALRQPLEDRHIAVSRARFAADFPANFILIATANPCPCGYAGVSDRCQCQQYLISKYQQRLSGPILDRIDLYADVHEVDHERLLAPPSPQDDDNLRARTARARQAQQVRFRTTGKLNAEMDNDELKRLSRLETAAKATLNQAAARHQLSARAYMRAIKVARTIADLEQSATITANHISEAVFYRRLEVI